MTPEGKVKKYVKDHFKRLGIYYHMPVQNGMGSPALDFTCCVAGRYVAVETKADFTCHLTPRQEHTRRQIEQSGGIVFVVYDKPTADTMAIVMEGLINAAGKQEA